MNAVFDYAKLDPVVVNATNQRTQGPGPQASSAASASDASGSIAPLDVFTDSFGNGDLPLGASSAADVPPVLAETYRRKVSLREVRGFVDS